MDIEIIKYKLNEESSTIHSFVKVTPWSKMSVSLEEEDPARDIFYVNFNQCSTALCVGARSGFNLYDLEAVYDCRPLFESRFDPEYYNPKDLPNSPTLKDVCIIERNFATCLVAYVKLEKPRNVFLYNYKLDQMIINQAFPNSVLSVRINRYNTVVCLEDQIHLLVNMGLRADNIHTITDTALNTKGLIALSYSTDPHHSVLAYPGAQGHVQIFDAYNKHAKMSIPAHTSQLAALVFDEDAEKLATASIRGTVIRVFAVATGDVLFEFRRGVKRCAEIHCLSFCKNPELLLASSNTETIHIFKLCAAETTEPSASDEPEGWMEMFTRVVYTQSTNYLPSQMTDVLKQPRSFAHVHLPFTEQKTVCTITHISNVPYVMVASLEGYLYFYDINMETGGSCHLVKQHRIEGPCQEGFLKFMNSQESKKKSLPSKEIKHNKQEICSQISKKGTLSKDLEVQSPACLEPQPTRSETEQEKEESPPLISYTTDKVTSEPEIPELCVVNGIKEMHSDIPQLLTEVEQ